MEIKLFDWVFNAIRSNDSITMESDIVIFRSRGTVGVVPAKFDEHVSIGRLNATSYEAAKDSAPGWDIYYLEREWLGWMTEKPRSRDAAFIGSCGK